MSEVEMWIFYYDFFAKLGLPIVGEKKPIPSTSDTRTFTYGYNGTCAKDG
jgi:hypothetical protein